MTEKLRWAVMGTGAIARAFAQKIASSETSTLVAVSSRSRAKAEAFGREFGVARCYGGYEGVLEDPQVEAVYISMIHPLHAEWAIRAAEAGKPILLEKPMTMNAAEAELVIEAARRHKVFLYEAFMYRCHPQTRKILEMIGSGALGRVRVIHASFSFLWGEDFEHRILKHQLGGGSILDVGTYTVSMARLLAGATLGQPFADPTHVTGFAQIGPQSRVDEYAVGSLCFEGGIFAQVTCGCRLRQDNTLRVYGTEGGLHVPVPWGPCHEPGVCTMYRLGTNSEMLETIQIPCGRGLFTIEIDTIAERIREGRTEAPEMTWADSLGNMRTLDRWRAAVGMKYDFE
ncbi:MAG: hypothetical protein Kow0059_02960 [Candidatus Sumerlaeia bacterium]